MIPENFNFQFSAFRYFIDFPDKTGAVLDFTFS